MDGLLFLCGEIMTNWRDRLGLLVPFIVLALIAWSGCGPAKIDPEAVKACVDGGGKDMILL